MNKRIHFILFLSLYFSFNALSQSKNDKTVVGKVGKEKITYGELKENFSSGVVRDNISIEELEEFLLIYLDYRSKVLEAKDLGYFENQIVTNEYQEYARQAAYAFWLENEIKPTRFDQYFKRASLEVSVEHVLIAVDDRASEEDTLKAYNSLINARNEYLNNGTSFAELNTKYSSTRNGRSMGGEIPWISVGVTVPEFEEVAFNLEPGEVSLPFRTQFGYHIVLSKEVRDRTPARNISHIFRRNLPSDTANMQFNKMNEAYEALLSGRTWSEVVREYSEDNLSVPKEGNIGWISYSSRYNPAFIDQIMALSTKVDISDPVKTVYGFHIFKIDSIQAYASEDERREKLLKEFESTPYNVRNNASVISYIRDYMGESINIDNLVEYENALIEGDTTIVSAIQIDARVLAKEFYSFNGKTYSIQDFDDFLKETKPNSIGRAYKRTWTNSFFTDLINDIIAELTVNEFEGFADQLDNYLEGLAVYQITDDNVWSAAKVDTSKLKSIYENSTDKYSLDKRNYYHIISVRLDSSLTDIIDFVNAGNSPDSLRSNFDYVGVASDSSNVFDGEPFDKLNEMKPGTFSEEFEYKRRKAIFYLEDVLPARKMTFEESFSRLMADYQPTREEEWLEKLRKKYKVKTDVKKLRKAFKTENSN